MLMSSTFRDYIKSVDELAVIYYKYATFLLDRYTLHSEIGGGVAN